MTYGRSGPATNVYRAPATDPCFETSAFHWANLTSGSRITALWILLTPYALANVAGWMAGWQPNPTTQTGAGDHQSWHRRLGRMSIRSASLALTALFMSQSLTAGVLLPMRWIGQNDTLSIGPVNIQLSIGPAAAMTGLVLAVTILFVWLVAVVSTRTHFPRMRHVSPVKLLFDLNGATMVEAKERQDRSPTGGDPREDPGGALVTDRRLWSVHPMLHRLRRLHLAGGLTVLALGVLSWTDQVPIAVVLVVLLAASALFGALITLAPTTSVAWWIGALAPHFSVGLLVISLISIWTTDPSSWHPEISHTLTFGISVVLAVFAFGALTAGPLSLGALVLATFSGVVLGTSIGLLIDDALGTGELIGEGVGWVAVAMLALIAWLVAVAAGIALFGGTREGTPSRSPLPWKVRRLVLLRRVVLEARVLFYAAGLFGIGAAIYVVAAIWRHSGKAGATELLDRLSAGLDPAALGTFPDLLVQVAVTIAIVVPGYFAIRSIRKGWISDEGGRGRRRQVGILWDLGSFWPRWYHPLAPPGYGPRAVRDLGEILDHLPEGSLLGAHSQGSLIAAVALHETPRDLGLISYGSQLGLLYPRMFPATGIPELVDAVTGRITNWVNLWRGSDPIGGQVVNHPKVEDRHVNEGNGHSRYEPTPTYSLTRRELAGIREGPC